MAATAHCKGEDYVESPRLENHPPCLVQHCCRPSHNADPQVIVNVPITRSDVEDAIRQYQRAAKLVGLLIAIPVTSFRPVQEDDKPVGAETEVLSIFGYLSH